MKNQKLSILIPSTGFYSVLTSLNLFVLADPYKEHWWARSRTRQEVSILQRHQPQKAIKFDDLQASERIIWCFRDGLGTRGLGWNWQMPHLKRKASYRSQLHDA